MAVVLRLCASLSCFAAGKATRGKVRRHAKPLRLSFFCMNALAIACTPSLPAMCECRHGHAGRRPAPPARLGAAAAAAAAYGRDGGGGQHRDHRLQQRGGAGCAPAAPFPASPVLPACLGALLPTALPLFVYAPPPCPPCKRAHGLPCLDPSRPGPTPAADEVVRQLREMVLLPMQYPSLFESMGLRPPR